jgi:SPP1 gp7 family putative phage head morphogenesis protein
VYQRHGFAVAYSTKVEVTQKVQALVAKGDEEGWDVAEGGRAIAELGGWSQAYSETVFQTNLANAYTAGRFRQVDTPELGNVIGAFKFRTRRDSNVRPNHAAAEGLIASPDDEIWDRLAPPLGFRCRCGLAIVTFFELKRLGLLKNGRVLRWSPPLINQAKRDKGFIGSRPDRRIYAA